MNVLLVSQCDKRALKETRRVIDQFAERRGTRTWQTPITQAGLDTLRAMLRKTARKNTAVACHWIRGADHSELVWIVGDASRFNLVGATPTNRTARDVLRAEDEHPWAMAETIKLVASMAALFHDFGKASDWFQHKLERGLRVADAYRHEWVSLKLFQAFVRERADQAWLEDLADPKREIVEHTIDPKSDKPFAKLGPVAQAVGWLVLSHHRLPAVSDRSQDDIKALGYLPKVIDHTWSHPRLEASDAEKRECVRFRHGTPFSSRDWRLRAAKVAQAMLAKFGLRASPENASRPLVPVPDPTSLVLDPYAMGVGRLALVVADHFYSGQPSMSRYGDLDHPLYANTDAKTGQRKQRLDEHLIGVASHTQRIMTSLLHLDRDLPRIARHRGFKRRTSDERFRWQDKAFDLASSLGVASTARGFFGVNMASTGCGKTLANGRILYGLADPTRGVRFTIALGLRTLTLQTGDAYRTRLGLGADDLAVLVGSAAVRALHEAARAGPADAPSAPARVPGSESAEALLDGDAHVHFEGSHADGPLHRWLASDADVSKLVDAPILACTIDHLMPACEATRGGHHVAPLLRLMTSDLVLDEPDDFDLADVPALARLAFTAGMMGSRVLLSSATLPPALVRGLFEAYARGRAHFQRHHRTDERDPRIPCAWFDEFGTARADATAEDFGTSHDAFVARRVVELGKLPMRRRVEILPFPLLPGGKGSGRDREAAAVGLASLLPSAIERLHEANHLVTDEGRRVSFGLVRLANVDPLIDVAVALRGSTKVDADFHLYVLVYHSKFPLLMRSATERLLDDVLQRQDPRRALTLRPVREACAATAARNVVFVVMASPVAEVGRDHDYDWAVVEPSSLRSLIQLAGRIRRHRPQTHTPTNILLLERNLRAAAGASPAYCWPGYEDQDHPLKHTSMSQLLRDEERERLDATPRIRASVQLTPSERLSDLEHDATQRVFAEGQRQWDARLVWSTRSHLAGLVQRHPRFRASRPQLTFAWRVDDDDARYPTFVKREDASHDRWGQVLWTSQDALLERLAIDDAPNVSVWGPKSYSQCLEETARLLERADVERVSERYGTVELDEDDASRGWLYHDTVGFRRKRQEGGRM
jgi:CRISPR-associated endonuclease/helicase Cas3